MATLLEQYKGRLAVSESVFKKMHNGEGMDNNKKLVVATCLDNTNKFLKEAFDSSAATQRADLGDFKRFCLNLNTVSLPNLIAHDLVIVHPMTSITGYIAYIQYVAGTTKGEVNKGDVFNDPFKLGDVDPNYTSQKVVEPVTADAAENKYALAWTPVVKGTFEDAAGTKHDVKIISGDNVKYANVNADGKTIDTAVTKGDKIAYAYNNEIIPQNNVPTLKAEMKNITLFAHARRIAVYYSQIAAFQAKTDYGFDLGDQLAEKAVGQLSYEIDTEIVKLLDETAGTADASLTWSKVLPTGVSKAEHYEGFYEVVEIARQIIYDRTRRFAPNYMIIASNILPVLGFIKGWNAAPTGQINGPYFAGTLGALKVFVSPELEAGRFVIGVNGDDFMSSVAVYAPYMPIVPTQLLQFNDGGSTQGWSTMYDLKVLNKELIVAGKIA